MSWAESYLGIPWITGGREVHKGLDCWGLLRYVYEREFEIGLSVHAAPIGHVAPSLEVVGDELESHNWLECTDPRDGDAIAMGRDGQFSHVGVYVQLPEGAAMIHTARKELSTIIPLVRLTEMGWNTVRFYRHAHRTAHH